MLNEKKVLVLEGGNKAFRDEGTLGLQIIQWWEWGGYIERRYTCNTKVANANSWIGKEYKGVLCIILNNVPLSVKVYQNKKGFEIFKFLFFASY